MPASEVFNMYRIVGIIDGHYIVQTPKGLKKVKISGTDKKNIRDEINIPALKGGAFKTTLIAVARISHVFCDTLYIF